MEICGFSLFILNSLHYKTCSGCLGDSLVKWIEVAGHFKRKYKEVDSTVSFLFGSGEHWIKEFEEWSNLECLLESLAHKIS